MNYQRNLQISKILIPSRIPPSYATDNSSVMNQNIYQRESIINICIITGEHIHERDTPAI